MSSNEYCLSLIVLGLSLSSLLFSRNASLKAIQYFLGSLLLCILSLSRLQLFSIYNQEVWLLMLTSFILHLGDKVKVRYIVMETLFVVACMLSNALLISFLFFIVLLPFPLNHEDMKISSQVIVVEICVILLFTRIEIFSNLYSSLGISGALLLFLQGYFNYLFALDNDVVFYNIIEEDNDKNAKLDLYKGLIRYLMHEIRIPIQTLSYVVTELEKSKALLGLPNNELTSEYFSMMNNSLDFMNSTVNETLALQRIGAGKMTINMFPTSVRLLLSSSLKLLKGLVCWKNISLIVTLNLGNCDVIVNCDMNMIHHVLANLVNNAVKFSDFNSQIEIVASIERNNRYVEIGIRDHGIGIADEDKAKLFILFNQGSQEECIRRRKNVDHCSDRSGFFCSYFSGSGIGLSLIKEVITMHQGFVGFYSQSKEKIALDKDEMTSSSTSSSNSSSSFGFGSTSGSGSGSYFYFQIPIKKVVLHSEIDAPDEKDLGSSVSAWSNIDYHVAPLQVLVVDDSVCNRKVLIHMIGKLGHICTGAENGRHCLEIFNAHSTSFFDVIVMDYSMPFMNGMETTAELRQKGYTNKIIIITGDLNLVTSDDSIPKVDVILGKPVTSDQIEKAILD